MTKKKTLNKNNFLDFQSTTPTDPDVLKIMNVVSSNFFANPHSSHNLGIASLELIKQSISLIQETLNSQDFMHIFTSGATESNNLFIRGLKDYLIENKLKALTLKTEHKCVLNSFHYLEKEGVQVEYLDVQDTGLVDLNYLKSKLDNVGLLSVMMVNNEIGTIQPIKEISKLTKEKGIIFHSDIAQAMGRREIDLDDLGVDAVSISGHKFYGPKGIGLLIINDYIKEFVKPLIVGGGQQDNFRSGTLPTPLCVGLARAIDLYQQEFFLTRLHHSHFIFADILLSGIRQIKGFKLNGIEASEDFYKTQRIASNLNLSFSKFEAFTLLNNLSSIQLSTGSACSAGEFDYSHVLRSLNLSDEELKGSIRVSQGTNTGNAMILLRDSLLRLHKESNNFTYRYDLNIDSSKFIKRNKRPKHQLYKILKYSFN